MIWLFFCFGHIFANIASFSKIQKAAYNIDNTICLSHISALQNLFNLFKIPNTYLKAYYDTYCIMLSIWSRTCVSIAFLGFHTQQPQKKCWLFNKKEKITPSTTQQKITKKRSKHRLLQHVRTRIYLRSVNYLK